MSYDSLEESVSNSQPIECYLFTGSNGKEYLYTSANTSVTLEGRRYTPVAASRSRIKVATNEDSDVSLDLELPFDTQVCIDHAYAQVPPKLDVQVYRKQARGGANDFVLYWSGRVQGFDVRGRVANIKVPSILTTALNSTVPNVYYQAPCNHVLYSSRCTAPRSSNKLDAIVGGASSTMIYLASTSGNTDDYKAGEIVNNRSLERRLIISNNGTEISIGYPFFDIRPGDGVTLYRGCDHTIDHCRNKFSNAINFGGFPYVPADNPFEGQL